MKKLNEILLIDDSKGTNSLNKRLLEEMNVANIISTALNGSEALDYLSTKDESTEPDLIFLDINMPIMNGYQFLVKYSEIKQEVLITPPIIMLSSSESEIDLEKSKNFPIVRGYESKPLTKEKVIKAIKNLLSIT